MIAVTRKDQKEDGETAIMVEGGTDMAEDERDAEFLERLSALFSVGRGSDSFAEEELRRIKHYGVYDEMYDFVMSCGDIPGGDVLLHRIEVFRAKPDRVVWTEEEFREKVRTGEVSKYDVIQMVDGFVPPQG